MKISEIEKVVGIVLLVVVVCLSAAYVGARYLLTKLDGTGGVQAPLSNGLTAYESAHIGLSFTYPDTYTVDSRHDTYKGAEIHVLTLIDKSAIIPDMSEGPTAISIIEIPDTPSSLAQWLKENSISNWQLIVDERASTSTVVAGVPAIWYHHTGLYENDAVAVATNGKIYLFSVSYLTPTDQIRADFNNLLKTVQFIHE